MHTIQAMLPIWYFAHSTPSTQRDNWQSLAEHLLQVGQQAKEFAAIFGAGVLADVAGRLHDLGKYTAEFQKRLANEGPRVDHSAWGAIEAYRRYGPLGQVLAYGIAGHHTGLANGKDSGERTALVERLKSAALPTLDTVWQTQITLPATLTPPKDFKLYGATVAEKKERSNFQVAFLARMLFSCLVDADFIDTERFYDRVENRHSHRTRAMPDLSALREKLNATLEEFKPDRPINTLRAGVLHHVRGQATNAPGLFSLTVPTGGGKTLASLAFALDHAIAHGLRRVIFVIPFTSIVEQNAAVFRQALGDLGQDAVLEHHSAFTEDRHQAPESSAKLRLAMENWDAPIVVTTAVQFFESLFAARPSQCRKLHNIAGSVIVLDEAQTMPLKLLRPCVAAIDELARNYRASVVLCTATQPALNAPDFVGGLHGVREVAPEVPQLFEQLKRVQIHHIGIQDDAALAQHLRTREQVLCIVNNRRHARALYQAMADLPGAYHLTTLMCAAHRSCVLAQVRQRLKDGLPCRLVSTSLIEAGVDVDFPTVLRAEAGLDSIIQAAGRCNREGKNRTDASEVLVFAVANEEWAPPPELVQYAQVAREVLRQHSSDPASPEAIRQYFQKLYWQQGSDALDQHHLMGLLQKSQTDSLPFETLAAKFRMIDNVQKAVIVPYDDDACRYIENDLPFAQGSVGLARKLQPYVVQLPRSAFDVLWKAGAIAAIAPEKWGQQFVVLKNKAIYDPHFGLRWDNPTFIPCVDLVV